MSNLKDELIILCKKYNVNLSVLLKDGCTENVFLQFKDKDTGDLVTDIKGQIIRQ